MKTCYCVKNTEFVGETLNQSLPLDLIKSCQYMECNDLDSIGRHSVALYMCLLNNGKVVLAVCFAPDCLSMFSFGFNIFWLVCMTCRCWLLLYKSCYVVTCVILHHYLYSQTARHPIAGLHFESTDVLPLDLVVLELIHCSSTGVDHRVSDPTQV